MTSLTCKPERLPHNKENIDQRSTQPRGGNSSVESSEDVEEEEDDDDEDDDDDDDDDDEDDDAWTMAASVPATSRRETAPPLPLS